MASTLMSRLKEVAMTVTTLDKDEIQRHREHDEAEEGVKRLQQQQWHLQQQDHPSLLSEGGGARLLLGHWAFASSSSSATGMLSSPGASIGCSGEGTPSLANPSTSLVAPSLGVVWRQWVEAVSAKANTLLLDNGAGVEDSKASCIQNVGPCEDVALQPVVSFSSLSSFMEEGHPCLQEKNEELLQVQLEVERLREALALAEAQVQALTLRNAELLVEVAEARNAKADA